MSSETSSRFDKFVGRERELGELRRALDETREGRGRMFLISGEPGIGKTRLAEEVAREATARGMRAVWGRCWEGDGAPAYWPWIQVIRDCVSGADSSQRREVLEAENAASILEAVAQIVPELRTLAAHSVKPGTKLGDQAQSQFRLFDSVASLLKGFARASALALLLDDLHDADLSSLMMLQLVAQEITGASILIVGTYRDLEVRRSPDLSNQIGGLSRKARSFPLAGLSQAEVAQFVGLSSGQTPDDELVSRLHAATAGNPLFVDGIVRTLIADQDRKQSASGKAFAIPFTLHEAIGRRLAMLSDAAQALLRVAAAIGNEFESELCLQVAGVTREEINALLDEASTAGITSPLRPGCYRYAHALIRAALHDTLDTNTRVRLHGRIAETIEQMHSKDLSAHFAELAYHYSAAGNSEKTIEWSHRAAQAAFVVFAYQVAGAHWREALALSEGQKDLRRADILHGLGILTAFHIAQTAGVPLLEGALSIYQELKNDRMVAATNVSLGLAFASYGMDIPRALNHISRAQEWNGELGAYSLGWLHTAMATAFWLSCQADKGIVAATRARQIREQARDSEWMSDASHIALLLMYKGSHREALERFRQVLAAVQDIANPETFRLVY